ncbi:MAG TPA: hypothetical protein VGM09_30020 [Bradyrhizobium sp.]|jgi:hypothetical protein
MTATHFEVLVEDLSGKVALEGILPHLSLCDVTYRIHSYRGIGRIPKGLTPGSDPRKRILLDQLPRLITGYGKTFADDPPTYSRFVVLICDLDTRDRNQFESEISNAIAACSPQPVTILCLSIEEGEAWLLGDIVAVTKAYPQINRNQLLSYIPDSICGTWEFMADLLEKGGAAALKKLGYPEIGQAKARWAAEIGALVDYTRSRSPSFIEFVEKIMQACA